MSPCLHSAEMQRILHLALPTGIVQDLFVDPSRVEYMTGSRLGIYGEILED